MASALDGPALGITTDGVAARLASAAAEFEKFAAVAETERDDEAEASDWRVLAGILADAALSAEATLNMGRAMRRAGFVRAARLSLAATEGEAA